MRRVSFPHMGNYAIAFKPLVAMMGDEVIVPPPITKRTLELGVQHSPDSVCVPFKYTLGTYIEALEQGANVLVQAGGGCRFGYYGEVQQQILTQLGYRFEFVKLSNASYSIGVLHGIKKSNPGVGYLEVYQAFQLALAKVHALDDIEARIRARIGFETRRGGCERLHSLFLRELDGAATVKSVAAVQKEFQARVAAVPADRPEHPLRIGIVGELYMVMEPFANFFLEKELGKRGVEVHRFITVSGILLEKENYHRYEQHMVALAAPYLKYPLGAHGTESVARTHQLCKQGFDGIIHIKPFACMPEVNAMSAMHRISQENGFPIMHLSFDAQTSETGIKTRLEAFYDMIEMRRQKHARIPRN